MKERLLSALSLGSIFAVKRTKQHRFAELSRRSFRAPQPRWRRANVRRAAREMVIRIVRRVALSRNESHFEQLGEVHTMFDGAWTAHAPNHRWGSYPALGTIQFGGDRVWRR